MPAYFDDGQFTLYQGDVRDCLRALPEQSVQSVVTSPPYYGLRNYGVDGQIGLERTPAEFIAVMVDVFREVRRVLADDGTLWLNLGDSYAGSGKGPTGHNGFQNQEERGGFTSYRRNKTDAPEGYKAKDLMLIPSRVAIALCDDGWYLRSDIAWCKRAPMPESVTDRPTSAWEHIFLLTKSRTYFYDADAIKESTADSNTHGRGPVPLMSNKTAQSGSGIKNNESFMAATWGPVTERNARNYWLLGPEPCPEAHFATFPTEIPRRAILAGSRPGDVVLDPFMGSGTTALVAKRLGRKSIGIELNPDYCELSIKRAGLQMMLEIPA